MSFLRNSAFNFVGGLLPAVALFVTIPLVVHRLGADAYGALVLITSIVGYFGIIDVNATAGSVKYVAEHHARGEAGDVSSVISFGLLLYLLIGFAGGVALFLGAETLVDSVFKIDASWHDDAVHALQLSAAAFFFGQLQTYLQSVPQSLNRYDLSGQFDAVFGTLAPLATVAVVLAGGGLISIVLVRLLLSMLHCAVLFVLLRRLLPAFRLSRPHASTMRKVSSFSAYTYLQRLATVTYLNADKLLIGAQQSLTALADYVIPYTLVNRVFALLHRLIQAIFPMTSALLAVNDITGLRQRYIYVKRYTLFLNVGVCLMFALFAQEMLHYWLHGTVAHQSVLVMTIVSYSLLAESLTNVPSLVNDGLGRPRITGITALLRTVLAVSAAWVALSLSGIVALALSQFMVTVLVSIGFIIFVHRRSLPWSLAAVARPVYGLNLAVLAAGSALVAWRFGRPLLPWWTFVAALLTLLLTLAALGWFVVLLPAHRSRLSLVIAARLPRVLRA